MKYLESKSRPQTLVIMDEYKEKLTADLAGLLLKPDKQLIEARKHIVNINDLSRTLSELAYPRADEFQMAIRTGDPKRISHAHMTFRRWADYTCPDKKLSDKVETVVFQYETKLYGKEFDANDADQVVKSSLSESQAILNQMVHNIDLAISQIPNWHNHKIVVEAIIPQNGWVVSEAKVTIGDSFQVNFVYEHTPTGFKIKDLNEGELPASLKADLQDLFSKLRGNPKYNRVLTLYMTRPLSERRYFEIAKRDLALGIEAVLPNHITLATTPLFGDSDIWKVRVEEKYLREYLHEGDVRQYHVIGDEAPIRWIERMSNEENR